MAESDDKEPKEVIYPPPEICKIIDLTASHVSKPSGIELEAKIRERERANPKFCFLNPGDPYFAYYQLQIQNYREGKPTGLPKEQLQQVDGEHGQLGDQEKSGRSKVPKEPPALEFAADTPRISALDMDVIKLTALFVARNGKQFMAQLANRESRNFQFDFMRSTHSCFPYFTKLVEQYTRILLPPKDLRQTLVRNSTDRYQILDKCLDRAKYQRYITQTQRDKEEKAEQERLAYLSIDWHDFVVLQSIDFLPGDDVTELPAPTTIAALQSMPLTQRQNIMADVQPVVTATGETLADQEEDMEF